MQHSLNCIPLIACLIVLYFSCESSEKTKTLKIAHGLDTTHPVHQSMIFFGKELEKNSNGKFNLKVYPNNQLGSERQCLELLQIGGLDMTKVSAAVLENFSPDMKVFGLPYLFRNRQHRFKVLDGPIGKELLNSNEKYWLRGLGYYDAGSRSFYTKEKPVESPEDLKGMKIRVMESVTAVNMVNHLGGSPTPISSGELYTALQQGVVDGAENNPPTFYLTREYEVCKYFSLDEHTSIPDIIIRGTHVWNTFSNQEKEWIQKAINTSVKYQRKLWEKTEIKALEAVKKAGVKVIYPKKKLFSNKVTGLYESYKNNERLYSFITRIKEAE